MRVPPVVFARSAGALAAMLAVALVGACRPPIQNGGVEVRAGAEERLGVLCRFGRGSMQGDSMCAAPERPPPSVVRQMVRAEDRLTGPLAIGGDGDWLMENDQVAVVIEQIGRGSGFAEGGGNVIDAADAHVRRDELGQMWSALGPFPRQAVYEAMVSGVTADGVAWIEARGHDGRDPMLRATTRYELAPGDRAITISTAIENGGAAIAELAMGDVIAWGSAAVKPTAAAEGVPGKRASPLLYGVGRAVAYAYFSAHEGSTPPWRALEDVSAAGWSDVVIARRPLAAGERFVYSRSLLVAPRGDDLSVATELFARAGGAPGGAEVELVDGKGAVVPAAPDGVVTVTSSAPASHDAPAGLASYVRESEGVRAFRVDAAGALAAELGPGAFAFAYTGGGRKGAAPAPTRVEEGKVARVRIQVSEPGAIRVVLRTVEAGVERPSPGKLQIAGDPRRPPILMPHGMELVALPPGRTRIIASRGPEFSVEERWVDVVAGQTTDVGITLARVVDTRGYVACDLPMQSARGAGSPLAMRSRVTAGVVEGLECALTGERDRVVDMGPVVKELGLEPLFRAIPRDAIANDASPATDGQVELVPLVIPPRSGRGADTGGRAIADYEALLRASHPFTPIADADTRGVVDREAGYPRTYVRVADDDPARLDAAALDAGLRRGRDVVLTNGPFVTMRVGAVGQGGIVTVGPKPGARAELRIHVERAPWVDARELVLHVRGGRLRPIALSGRAWPSGSIVDDVVVRLVRVARARPEGKVDERARTPPELELAEDTFVFATLRGSSPLRPVLEGEDAEIAPFAMTSPLWIDADGDGRSLGR